MLHDADTCYRAIRSRDRRFDGVFFVGVTTTGIYCRPVCTARTPGQDRCRFFESAAQAERDGFRACFVCRPELAPGSARIDAGDRLVERAVHRIEAGALNETSVEALALELDVSGRHLRRAVVERLGVSPVELAQTGRLAFAKRLLQDSSLPLAELAFASGFQSVRRFNALFRSRFGRPPSAVRRDVRREPRPTDVAPPHEAGADSVSLRLDYRPPFAWEPMLAFLAHRAIPGVETIEPGVYRRTVSLAGKRGWVEVRADSSRPALIATASLSLLGVLMPLVSRLRALFDLDAQPLEIDRQLKRDPLLRRRVAGAPGLRVPGAFDGFETAVRAILGQQITVRGATTLAGRLAERFGLDSARIAAASTSEIAAIGMPGSRADALIALARAVEGGLTLHRGVPVEPALERLRELPGVGEWTAQYIAMRALGWPDAFPSSDLGVLKALGVKRATEALTRAEAWRPWRAYATLHLWRTP